MGKLENAFDHAEVAAESMLRAANSLVSLSKRMQTAAKEGKIDVLKKHIESLKDNLGIVQTEVQNAGNAWTMTEDEEETYLAGDYIAELQEISAQQGLELFERDGAVVAYPSKLIVLPKENAIRLDGKKVLTIRPSCVASILRTNQLKRVRSNSPQFLESLYKVYRALIRTSDNKEMFENKESIIHLSSVYEVMTALPGFARDYDRLDFAKDLYLLDVSGLQETRNGTKFKFHADTGAKSGRGTFVCVDRNGQDQKFHDIQFLEG